MNTQYEKPNVIAEIGCKQCMIKRRSKNNY